MSLFVPKKFFNLAFVFLVFTSSGSCAAESLFTLKANDPLRLAMQPVGILRFYTAPAFANLPPIKKEIDLGEIVLSGSIP